MAADFMRLIQTPSTRIKDPELLAYAWIHAMSRFSGDYAICCAALCVIGYRILNKEINISDLDLFFKEQAKRFIDIKPNIPFGLYLRWHSSLRLIMGYLAYQSNDLEEVRIHFEKISEFESELKSWPTFLYKYSPCGICLGLSIA